MSCSNIAGSGTSAQQKLMPCMLAVLVTAAVMGGVVHNDFVAWDDDLHVYANPHFQSFTWGGIKAFWRASYQHLYIPLPYTLWAALVWLNQMLADGGLTAGPFHSLNLLVHLGSVLVVYRLALVVMSQENDSLGYRGAVAAALGALVFGIHPLQVEAVAWVSGFRDVLWGWWALLAVWQYLEYVKMPRTGRRRLHYGVATAAFGLAILSKPAAVIIPIVAWLLDVGCMRRSWWQASRSLSVWLVVAGSWGIGTKMGQPDSLLSDVPSWPSRLAVATDAIAFYLAKLVWPFNLGPDYGRTPLVALGDPWGTVRSLVAIGLGAILWLNRRKWPILALASGIFVAALLPVLGVIPFAFQAYSTVADRYAYLAMLGPALVLAWVVCRTGHRWPSWAIGILILGMLGGRSAAQISIWGDTMSLFTHGLRVNRASSLAHNNLGLALANQGALDEATAHFRAALALKPDLPEAHYNLGMALTLKGAFDTAIAQYDAALQLRPDWAEAYNNRGIALESQEKYADALTSYVRALLAKPGWAEVHYNLGNVFAKQGRVKEAILAYRTALRQRPSWPMPAINLSRLLTTQQPVSPEILAEAVRLAEHACQATDYQDPTALYTLARAYQVAGRPEAHTMARRAMMRANATGFTDLATQIGTDFSLMPQQESNHVSH